MTAYLPKFERLSTIIMSLSWENLLNCFLSGLREDIYRELYLLKSGSLHNAMGMAKIVKDKCNSVKSKIPPPPFPRVPLLSSPNPSNNRPPSLPIRRMTPAQMAARRKKGFYYNCDSCFTPGHRCKPSQFLCLLAEMDNEALSQDVSMEIAPTDALSGLPNFLLDTLQLQQADQQTNKPPYISFHALTGQVVPSTLSSLDRCWDAR